MPNYAECFNSGPSSFKALPRTRGKSMNETAPYIVTGMIFGLSAGIAPGPLLALVISETISLGRNAGLWIAVSPVFTDIPIIAAVILLISNLPFRDTVLGSIALIGAIYLVSLGLANMKSRTGDFYVSRGKGSPLKKGILANALNPHPYLFWITIGTPVLFRAGASGPGPVIAFLLSFYICLIGIKAALAIMLDRVRSFLNSRLYIWIMRILGAAMILLAFLLCVDGLRLLGAEWI